MTRPRAIIAVTVALAVLAVVFVSLAGRVGAAEAHRAYPTRLLVYAREFSLSPSRASLPAGPVTVQLWDQGSDPHDLRARRLGPDGEMVGRTWSVALTLPGQVRTGHWALAPGRYELYCSLPGHMQAGMHVQITVGARGAPA